MEDKTKYSTRHRIKLTQSTKNKITAEVSVEMIDSDRTTLLKEAGSLLAEAIVIATYREKELNCVSEETPKTEVKK